MKSDYDRSKTIFCKTTENYHPLDPPLLICRHINSGINKDESYRMRMYKLYTENMPYPDLSITLVKSVKSFRYTWVVAATLIALPEYYHNRFRLSIAGADPGEVKWVNFHPPFFLSPLLSFFFLIPQILK